MFVSIGAIAHLGTPYTRCGQLELALLAVWLRKLVWLVQLLEVCDIYRSLFLSISICLLGLFPPLERWSLS